MVPGPNYRSGRGNIEVSKNGKKLRMLYPEKRVYNASGMPMTEAAIDTNLTGDYYVSLGEPVSGEAWSVRLYHKPFVDWIWAGCFTMALGGILAVSDRRYRLAARKKRATTPPSGSPGIAPNLAAEGKHS